MGNPHCVFVVNDVDSLDLLDWGSKIESHELFPQKTNVEFIQIIDKQNIRQRTFERGVGETLACGSGACAAAVVANRKGLTDRNVDIHLGTIHLRRWQIFTIFDPYPPTIGIPAKCL